MSYGCSLINCARTRWDVTATRSSHHALRIWIPLPRRACDSPAVTATHRYVALRGPARSQVFIPKRPGLTEMKPIATALCLDTPSRANRLHGPSPRSLRQKDTGRRSSADPRIFGGTYAIAPPGRPAIRRVTASLSTLSAIRSAFPAAVLFSGAAFPRTVPILPTASRIMLSPGWPALRVSLQALVSPSALGR